MKKFFLYFIFFLLVAGLAMLAYGFWNAKNIRQWALSASELKVKYNPSREKNIEDGLNASGGKKAADFNKELAGFVTELDSLSRDLENAEKEARAMIAPRAGRETKEKLEEYFKSSREEIDAIRDVAGFMNNVFEVAVIFDTMNPDTTAQEIRDRIVEGRAKAQEIEIDNIPQNLQAQSNDLKVAVENYLDQFDQYATGKIESHDQLSLSYAEFSRCLNDFLLEKKKFIDSLSDKKELEARIDNDLVVLANIRFSLK